MVSAVRRLRPVPLFLGLLLLGAAIGVALALIHSGGTPAVRSDARAGWPFHRRVPAIALTSAGGRPLSLRDLHGKVVVLAPSLTLCHEVCPLTTQALMLMRRSLASQGLGGRVALVEATVDPWRDSPARLRAYARMTGARLVQLTGSVAQMRRFWDYFGIGFRRVPQGPHPDVDWWTGRVETFDVEHVDGVFAIDRNGYERRFFPGYADTGRRLEPALRRLLSQEGVASLEHPSNAWTVEDVMSAVGRLLGVRLKGGA